MDRIDDSQYQTRAQRDEESDYLLTRSIQNNGVLQPILLRDMGENFIIIAGHRRFAAAKEIRLEEIPAYVLGADDGHSETMAFHENVFRRDLSPIEEAAAVNDMLSSREFNNESLAKALNKSTNWIAERVVMCEWPAEVSFAVHTGRISVSAARNLVRIADETRRQMLTNYAVDNGATARVTAAWLQSEQAGIPADHPADIEPVPGAPPMVISEPQIPCIFCEQQFKQINITYLPICGTCQSEVVLNFKHLLKQQESGNTR